MNMMRDSADNRRDEAIQANNILGLNTVASPPNAPYGSTPDTLNTVLTVGGTVEKRPGTRAIYETSDGDYDAGTETYGTNITTSLGYHYTIVVGGQTINTDAGTNFDLQIFEVNADDDANLVMTKEKVFSEKIRDVPINFTKVDKGRLLITSGVNAPVELRVQEYRLFLNGSDFAGTYSLTPAMKNISADELLVYQDGVRLDPTDYSTSGDVLGTTANFGAAEYVDVIRFVWGYWTEATIFFGNRYWDSVPRFRVYESDRHVQIPEQLRDGQDWQWIGDGATQKWGYPIRLTYSPDDESPSTSYVHADSTPTTAYQYYFSDGTAGTLPNNSGKASTHVTFGDIHASGEPSGYVSDEDSVNVYFGRMRSHFFAYESPPVTDIVVWNKQRAVSIPIQGSATSSDEFCFVASTSGTNLVTTAGSNQAERIGFWYADSADSVNAGVPADEQIVVLHSDIVTYGSDTLKNIGSNAQTTYSADEFGADENGDGFLIPVYGIQNYADYVLGIFPYVATMYGNRLVLGGFANDPLRVAISAPNDVYVAGEFYTYFQADAFNNPQTAPDDFVVGSSAQSEFIRGMTQWQGSLFIFTNTDVWRVTQGESGRFQVQKASSFGLVDSDSYALGDGRLFFASKDGVFEMVQSGGLADTYVPEEVSVPIRNLFMRDVKIDHMSYDESTNRLYCVDGTKIYVYFGEVGGWTVWEFASTPDVWGVFTAKDQAGLDRSIFIVTAPDNTDAGVMLMADSFDTTLNVYDYQDYQGGTQFINAATYHDSGYSVSTDEGWVKHNLTTMGVSDLEDLYVFINPSQTSPFLIAEALDFETEWWHVTPNTIRIDESLLSNGDDVWVLNRNPENGALNDWRTYRAYWKSIKMTRGMLSRYKRQIYFNGYFSLTANGDIITTPTFGGTVGERPRQTDASIAFLFEDARSGESSIDMFTVFDDTYSYQEFPAADNINQLDYVLVREYIQGIGTDFQFQIWSQNSGTWALAGFQIEGKIKGSRHIAR